MVPTRHDFIVENFPTESGVVLPQARLVYGTYGTLNEARDNAVLLPSHYMADCTGYDWLIGPGKALDPERLFLVMTEMFGNGRSSSPSNTEEPHHGPRFPVTTIRDNVEICRKLLESYGISRLQAVIGFSMGAQQAFQWAVSHPEIAGRIVATAGTAKSYHHGNVRLEGQIAALTTDAAFQGGDYMAPPQRGLEAFAMVWTAWLYSQEWWRRETWRAEHPNTDFDRLLELYRTNFIPGADANDLILQMRCWQRHDVGTSPGLGGDVEAALRSIAIPVLYMPGATDLYFPLGDAQYEASFIRDCRLVPIPSLWGHTAGAGACPEDARFLNDEIGTFMAAALQRSAGA